MPTKTPSKPKSDPDVVAADQAAMAEARAAAEAEAQAAEDPDPEPEPGDAPEAEAEVEIEERKDGQLAIGGPGTEPRFSTDAGGPPPESAELKIASKKVEWGYDMERGTELLFLSHVRVGDVTTGAVKTFNSEVVTLVEFDAHGMGPREAIMAVHDLKSRAQFDRAVIDNAAQIAQEILENEAPESGVDLAAAMRERMYERFHIDADAHEATFGVQDDEVVDAEVMEEPVSQDDDPEWEEPDQAEVLAARERRLEEQIASAVAEGDSEAEEALREELSQVRLQQQPELAWGDESA